jgi:hypothetical protein
MVAAPWMPGLVSKLSERGFARTARRTGTRALGAGFLVEPPVGIEPMTYALRARSRALLAGFKVGASFTFVGCGGWRSLAANGNSGASRGHGGAALILDRLLFRPDISQVHVDRAGVMRCRRSLLLAGGCCRCCHRCCQPRSGTRRILARQPVVPSRGEAGADARHRSHRGYQGQCGPRDGDG